MKIYIVGSVKIDSWLRKILFINSIKSLDSVSSLFYWNFNIVGKYAKSCHKEVLKHYKDALVTNNNDSTYYEIVKEQIS